MAVEPVMEASRVASKYSTKIENLSECILIHILSFLPTFDAIRTTLVCRTWRNLWYQVPSLTFDIVPFYIVPFQSSSNTYITTRDKFFQCVSRAISIHPFTHVKKFQLRIDCDDDSHIANVNNWVLHVINSKVIELDIDFDISYIKFILSEENGIFYRGVGVWKFCFDFSHLKDSSVKVLMLRRSLIHCPPYVCTSDFQSVQSLFFDDLRLKDREVNDVIKLCVNLEYLTIQFCSIPKDLEIYSSKLKKCELIFLDASEVVISAPMLHSVIIDDVWAKVYFLKPSPNLVVAKVEYYKITVDNYSCWCHFMSTLAATKYLTVRNMYFGREFLKHFKKEEDALKCYKFNNITHLVLRTGYTKDDIVGICLFLEHSHTLESLAIENCSANEEEEITEEFVSRAVNLQIPRVRKVKMMNYRGIKGEFYVVELIKRHQLVLEEVVAFPPETASFPLWTASNSNSSC